MYKGIIGATHLNDELQKDLNPHGQPVTLGSRTFKLGDKVMQIVNNYEKDVFNGDIGFIRAIDLVEHTLMIDFDGRLVTDVSGYYDYAFATAVQSDGRIVVAGLANNSWDDDFALVRYNSDGSLDTTFASSRPRGEKFPAMRSN